MADNLKTRSRVLVVMSLIALWQVSRSVVLTPSSISACPGDEIIVKCSESETTISMTDLRWIVTPQNRQFHTVDLHLANSTIVNEQRVAGVKFCSELSSFSPLISTFVTTAHPLLNGSTVTCTTAASADTLTIRVLETVQPEIQWVSIAGVFEAENVAIVIEWESNSSCFNYTILLTSPNERYTKFTTNTSQTFDINYNINYTVTIVSSNKNSSSELSKSFMFIKCEPPSHRENVIVSGYVSPALENSQISLSCLPGYSFPNDMKATMTTSTCVSEAVWSPDISMLECQRNCGPFSFADDVYRILNQTNNSFSVGSTMEFQCVHTPYLMFTTQCLLAIGGPVWTPHPKDVCGQCVVGYGKITIAASLGAVIALVCLAFIGTLSALVTIVIKYRKDRNRRMDNRTRDAITEVTPGSGILTPNVSYEPTRISQKQRVPYELERNPAYATMSPVCESNDVEKQTWHITSKDS